MLFRSNNAKSNKLTDQVFWYKAEPHDDFKLCSPDHWNYSQENENNEINNNVVDNKKSQYTITKQWS